MYSTSKTNLPGSVRLHDLYESWARMFPEMARYTNKSEQIGKRVPQYLKDAHRGSAKKRKAPVDAPPPKRAAMSAWDGLLVEDAGGPLVPLNDEELDLDQFVGL